MLLVLNPTRLRLWPVPEASTASSLMVTTKGFESSFYRRLRRWTFLFVLPPSYLPEARISIGVTGSSQA